MDDTERVRERALLQRLYLDEGLSTRTIAARFGVSAPTIVKRLREHGIPVRSPNTRVVLVALDGAEVQP